MTTPLLQGRGRVLVNSAGTEIGASGTSLPVVGNVAAGATDSGNPVKAGGVRSTTLPSLTDGQRGNLQLDAAGRLLIAHSNLVTGSDGFSNAALAGVSAANDTISGARYFITAATDFNGTSWDRRRNNQDTAAMITAAGATTSQTGADQTNYNGKGLQVVLDMTVVGTGSVTITIQGKDAASGKYYTLLAGAAVVTNSTNLYTVYPGAPTTTNVSASLPLPRVWRVITTANNANATTYTVGASVIL